MRKVSAGIATSVFFFLAPGMVAGLVPWLITHWRFQRSSWDPVPLRWLGAALIVIGVIALVECFARFAVRGRGTPAPVLPTEVLVVSGLYRYVRNPMYVAVLAIVFGQALFFGSEWALIYGACVWGACTAFVVLYEEPTLRRRYGEQYNTYCRHVRRWIPRLTPWRSS
ncbi:MAG TPA: isoprenylcysteine carboxylmethyltransferase family protein [Acidobacteriaceae bacterium]|nr:isoprenylcysteine carboxylmethyltransferase family protein [Acidobacteriaceae bacterium]